MQDLCTMLPVQSSGDALAVRVQDIQHLQLQDKKRRMHSIYNRLESPQPDPIHRPRCHVGYTRGWAQIWVPIQL